MSVTHSPAAPEDPTTNQPTQDTPAPETTQNTSPPPSTTCSCPTSSPSSEPGTDAPHAALISADIDAGASGVQANIDALGHDLADVSIGLGALDLGALDKVLGLVDGLACGDSATSSAPNAPLISAAVNADLSGVQANADVLGHDAADVSIGLGAVDSVLALVDSNLGLVDSGSGLVDGLLCDIV